MGVLEAIVYGIVQGLTEFLPISSTAHLRIVPSLLGWQDPGAAFTAVIQLGTLLAVLIYFRKDLVDVFLGWVKSFSGPKDTVEAKVGWGIVIGTLPIVILGFAFKHQIKSDAVRSLYVVAASLIVMGIVLFIAEKVGSRKREFDQLTAKDGLVVGLWQAIALIPGASRSGSTISGALFSGLSRPTAARFSFLLSIPSVLAAGLYELMQERKELLGAGLAPTLIATVISFVVGYASIAYLMKLLQTKSTMGFVIYRIALGILLIALLQMGKLQPLSGVTSPESPRSAQRTTLQRHASLVKTTNPTPPYVSRTPNSPSDPRTEEGIGE